MIQPLLIVLCHPPDIKMFNIINNYSVSIIVTERLNNIFKKRFFYKPFLNVSKRFFRYSTNIPFTNLRKTFANVRETFFISWARPLAEGRTVVNEL